MKITLKAARVNAGMTQREAAKAINVSRISIQSWENGWTNISAVNLLKLCKLYNVTPEDIFFADKHS